MDDFEGIVNLFQRWGWVFLRGQKQLREGFWRLSLAQMRLGEDELEIGIAWVKVSKGLWVVILNWNSLKLRNTISIFEALSEICRSGQGPLLAWKMKETPSSIYREGVWMVWRERGGSLLQKWWRVEACLRLNLGRQGWLCSDLVCTPDQLVFTLSIDLEQTQSMKWPAMQITFCHFWKSQHLHMGSIFEFWHVLAYKLTSYHVTLSYVTCFGTIGITLRGFGHLMHPFANSAWIGLVCWSR